LWWSIGVGASGVVAGVLTLLVGWAYDKIEAITPDIQKEYQNNPAFRAWPGWSATYMIVHPLWFGIVFALVYGLVNQNRVLGGWLQEGWRGLSYGAIVFLVGSLPIFALVFASFRVPFKLVLVSWALRNLTQYLVAGFGVGVFWLVFANRFGGNVSLAGPIRMEVQRLVRSAPFRPFALNLENGDRVIIEHPENIAFDPGSNGSSGSEEFYVISGKLRLFSTFGAVASVKLLDQGGGAE
jgi:hypothetical protein